jgi:hypothetical protein
MWWLIPLAIGFGVGALFDSLAEDERAEQARRRAEASRLARTRAAETRRRAEQEAARRAKAMDKALASKEIDPEARKGLEDLHDRFQRLANGGGKLPA